MLHGVDREQLRALQALEDRVQGGFRDFNIRLHDGEISVAPGGEYKMAEENVLVVLGKNDQLSKLKK